MLRIKEMSFGAEAELYARSILQSELEKQREATVLEGRLRAKGALELKTRLAHTIRAFKDASSAVMRNALEKEADELAAEIGQSEQVAPSAPVALPDIEDFVKDMAEVLEHPALLLESVANTPEMQAVWDLLFQGLPTYEEFAFGTPEYSWFYSVFSSKGGDTSILAEREGFEPSRSFRPCRFSKPVHSTTLPPLRDPTVWLSELVGKRALIQASIREMVGLLPTTQVTH